MAFSYDPSAVKDALSPGNYSFKIKECDEGVFKSTSRGIIATLEFVVGNRIITITDGFPYPDKRQKGRIAAFKKLCLSVGVRFDPPPGKEDMKNKTGVAYLDRETREDGSKSRFLEVAEYLPQGARSSAPEGTGPTTAPTMKHPPDEEDVPF